MNPKMLKIAGSSLATTLRRRRRPDTIDTLTPLERWVEQGVAPDRIIASKVTGGTVTRTRLLCPYPQVAKYNGTGSIDAAASFACTSP